MTRRGQTSLIMIILAAMALIFFAATLNWGKVAQSKSQVTIAANSAAASMASGAASYGEQVLQETLGGRPKYCKSTSVWAAIAMLVIAVIVACIPGLQGVAFALAVLAVAMAAVSLALQVLVIQPGLTSLWNKLQQSQSTENQFVESGIVTGLQGAVTDDALVPDYFDMDVDGKFRGNSNDVVGRFGFMYTERLKLLEPPTINGLDDFLNGLKVLSVVEPTKYTVDCSSAAEVAKSQADKSPCCRMDCNLPANTNNPDCVANVGTDQYAPPSNCSFALSDPCQDSSRPECNACCLPLYDSTQVVNRHFDSRKASMDEATCLRLNIPLNQCNSPMVRKRLRPQNCGPDVAIPDQCKNGVYGPLYPYTYDPTAQNNTDTKFLSFLEQLGRDDEHKVYKKNAATPNDAQYIPSSATNDAADANKFLSQDATGHFPADQGKNEGVVYPLLWAIAENQLVAPRVDPLNLSNTHIADSAGLLGTDADKDIFLAGNTDASMDQACAQDLNTTDGIWNDGSGFAWKKGAPRYCAAITTETIPTASINGYTSVETVTMAKWPYFANCPGRDLNQQCTINGNADAQQCSACSTSANHADWPDDPVDDMVYGLGEFVDWGQKLAARPRADLVKTFTDWYPEAATWIGTKCPNSCTADDVSSDCVACHLGVEGRIRRYAVQLGGAVPIPPAGDAHPLDANGNPTGGWYKKIDDWMSKDVKDITNQAWCVPQDLSGISASEKYATFGPMLPAIETQIATMTDQHAIDGFKANNANYPPEKINSFTAMATKATINEVDQCMGWNSTDTTRFNDCLNACSNASATANDYEACYNLPRSLVVGFTAPPMSTAIPVGNRTVAAARANCLNNCNALNCTAVLSALAPAKAFNASMCVAGKWDTSATASASTTAAYNALTASVNASYANTVCRNFDQLLQSRDKSIPQTASFLDRYNKVIHPTRVRAQKARQIFKDGYIKLKAFLVGPAQTLINARKNYQIQSPILPSFGIYGWQSTTPIVGETPPRGRWHIVRTEAFGATRCGSREGCQGRLPWVRTYQKGFLGTTRCYVLESHTGSVYVRVTRYDESSDGVFVNFANQAVGLWHFLGGSKTSSGNMAGEIAALTNSCGGVGIHPNTICAFGTQDDLLGSSNSTACPGLNNFSREERDVLRAAFMINHNVAKQSLKEKQCAEAAETLLSRGVMSESCAQYELVGNHLSLRFRPCPSGSFNAGTTEQ